MPNQISFAEVSGISSKLSTDANSMKDILNEVQSIMSKINQSDTWKSDAAASLEAKFQELSRKFEGFYTLIEAYSKYLTSNVVANWEDADKALKQNAQG